MKSNFFKLLILTIIISLSSCKPSKRYIILQNHENLKEIKAPDFEAIIQPDNLLSINITSLDSEISALYNLGGGNVNFQSQILPAQLSYQVDQNGYIQIPNLGIVKASGKTRSELETEIKKQLEGKIKDPNIIIRILNFKVTFQGEVVRPGVLNITTERVTMFEAISMVGDLTVYGKRNNILIVREENNTKTFNYVDITDSEFINSPFYYLNQNDLIYVEPNNVKSISAIIGPTFGLISGSISLVLTVILLINR